MIDLILHKKLDAENGTMHLNVEMNILQGSFVALFGDSGAGKTSILRMIAGLMQPEKGLISLLNETWLHTEEKINIKPQNRNIGFLFQDYALFPNMTVRENLLYALDKGQSEDIIDELITLIELEELQNKKPDNLSGGQKQRVALARTLVRRPKLLLLDEPFSSLDYKMRLRLQDYLLKVHQQYQLTTILVSHNRSEIVKMADEIYVLENGLITQKGEPIDIFSDKKVSGEFQVSGEIIEIKKEGIIFVITVLMEKNFIKVIADDSEVEHLNVGDLVMLASKAFNPMIYKLH